MKRKLTGSTTAALSMFLLSGVLASVLGVRQFERFTTHEILGMNGNWPAGVSIESQMLRKIRVSKDIAGVVDQRMVLGKQLSSNKKDGEILRPTELRKPVRSWLAQQIPAGKVLYTMAPRKGSIPHSQLRNGDLFDVIATGRNGVRTVARDVRLIGVLGGKSPAQTPSGGLGALAFGGTPGTNRGADKTSLVVAVAPEYVYPLASIGGGDTVSIVLHGSRDADQAGERPVIDPKPTRRSVELVTGLKRRVVNIDI